MADVFEQFGPLPSERLEVSGVWFEGGGKRRGFLDDLQDPVASGGTGIFGTDVETNAEVGAGGGNAGGEFLAIGHGD